MSTTTQTPIPMATEPTVRVWTAGDLRALADRLWREGNRFPANTLRAGTVGRWDDEVIPLSPESLAMLAALEARS